MTIRHFIAISVFVLATVASAQDKPATPATFALVNGEAISAAQVTTAAAAELAALEAKKATSPASYEREKLIILHRAMGGIIEDKLISLEAAQNQMTKEQLRFAEVESNVATPSSAEIEAFYQANRAQIPVPHDEAVPLVKKYLMDQARARYEDALFNRLKKKFPVKVYLDPIRAEVPTAGFPSRGPANAVITIVEFSDFQCPFCGGLFPTLKAIEKNYPDQVRLVYRQFPLNNLHPLAQKAAEASLCANDQKRFWEFHDSMFGDQAHLSVTDLKQRAAELKLNTTEFNTCLDSGAKDAAVKRDIDEGSKLGVRSTPSMFINGRGIAGNQPYADIREVIEDELQRQSQANGGVR